jgi:hypothetical protein
MPGERSHRNPDWYSRIGERARGRQVEHAAVQAGGERPALTAHDDDADVVVQGRADGGQGRPGGRRLRVQLVGTVQGDGEDGAVPARPDPARVLEGF